MLLVLVLLGTARAGFSQASEDQYPVLYELEPRYSVLNITGWETYPACWLFPQPAVSLVYEGNTYLVAIKADTADTSGGKAVADAWCQ